MRKFKLSWFLNRGFQLLVIGLFAKFLFGLKWHLIIGVLPSLGEAVWLTIQLTVLSLGIGFLLAWPIALLRAKRNPEWLAMLADGYVALFRGTPLLVQIFLIYYGLGGQKWMQNSFLWPIFREPYWCVVIGFSLNSAAYACEIFRGALMNGGKGEREAAKSLGLSAFQTDWLVWVPASWRRALPQYGNEMIFMMHSTAIAGLVTMTEVFGWAKDINGKFYVTYEGLIAASIVYIILTTLLIQISKLMEKYYLSYMNR